MEKTLQFQDTGEVVLDWCGKFQAPGPEWIHMTRNLVNYELMVVTEGILYIADAGRRYAVKKGEYLLMAPTPMQYGWQKGSCSFYWLHFTGREERTVPGGQEGSESAGKNRSPGVGEELGNSEAGGYCLELPAYQTLSQPERVIILMKQLQDCSRRYHNKAYNDSMTRAILYEIACQCSRQKQEGEEVKASQLFYDVADYIQYFVNQPIKVAEIADNFGYSSKYLSELFRRYAGMTVKQYILQQKMEYAMAVLSDTNRTVGQIADEVGFRDANNFTNAFKKYAGMSPSQYRDSFGQRALFYK